MSMQHMTPAPITTDIGTDVESGSVFLGFAFVVAFYAIIALAIAAVAAA